MSEAPPPIEKLAWDSAHFGFGVGRVGTSRLTGPQAQFCVQQARESGIRCLYFLAESGDRESWRAAEAAGFEPIDVRVELILDVSRSPRAGSGKSRQASEADLPRLLELARDSFVESRFFRDPRFPREKSGGLFEIWVERGVRDARSFTLVERGQEVPKGFASARTMPGRNRPHRARDRVEGVTGNGSRQPTGGIGRFGAGEPRSDSSRGRDTSVQHGGTQTV